MRICVYCSSSARAGPAYVAAARKLGQELAAQGHELIYGGGNVGLMGHVARTVRQCGGRVTGIIPERLTQYDVVYRDVDELLITETMAQRKGLMIQRAEAFIALPGGFGTLEELTEVLTLKQLGYLDGALVLLNVDGFYDRLLGFFEQIFELEFARPDYRTLYHVADGVDDALAYIQAYARGDLPSKWF